MSCTARMRTMPSSAVAGSAGRPPLDQPVEQPLDRAAVIVAHGILEPVPLALHETRRVLRVDLERQLVPAVEDRRTPGSQHCPQVSTLHAPSRRRWTRDRGATPVPRSAVDPGCNALAINELRRRCRRAGASREPGVTGRNGGRSPRSVRPQTAAPGRAAGRTPARPGGARRGARPGRAADRRTTRGSDQTQPVGLGRPATLQAPLAGPDGNSS